MICFLKLVKMLLVCLLLLPASQNVVGVFTSITHIEQTDAE
jgi:hypothetical protein